MKPRANQRIAALQTHLLVMVITPARTRGGTTRCAGGRITWWITTVGGTGWSAWCVEPLWPHWRSALLKGMFSRSTLTRCISAQWKSSRPCRATTRLPCISSILTTAFHPGTTDILSWPPLQHTWTLKKGFCLLLLTWLQKQPSLFSWREIQVFVICKRLQFPFKSASGSTAVAKGQ